MGPVKPAVGNLLDQCQDDQRCGQVEGPLADHFGEAALCMQPAEKTIRHLTGPASGGALQPPQADQPFGPLCPAPVRYCGRQRGDPQPFVQPIDFVQSAEAMLQPAWADCQV